MADSLWEGVFRSNMTLSPGLNLGGAIPVDKKDSNMFIIVEACPWLCRREIRLGGVVDAVDELGEWLPTGCRSIIDSGHTDLGPSAQGLEHRRIRNDCFRCSKVVNKGLGERRRFVGAFSKFTAGRC